MHGYILTCSKINRKQKPWVALDPQHIHREGTIKVAYTYARYEQFTSSIRSSAFGFKNRDESQ